VTGPSILLIEDDTLTRLEIARHLRVRDYQVTEADGVRSALRAWDQRRTDALLVDLGLPDGDGVDVIRAVRRTSSAAVIVLSARGSETAKVEALDAGADDYLTKPFSMAELDARVRAVLRRVGRPEADPSGVIHNGTLTVDRVAHEVRVGSRRLALTPREFQILAELLSHPGRLVTRGRLLRAVWGEAYGDADHYIHVYVSQIRRKLAAVDREGELSDLLVTEPGVGYRVRLGGQS
jgi:two-component system KDP operon response regulator KdpE